MTPATKKPSFASQLGFVLATAGSAVGLGNLWRFPYCAAKDGGGLFLIIYILIVLTLGYALMTSEMALGRKTGASALNAFKEAHPAFGWVGKLAYFIPAVILTYYVVIGGWVLKYLLAFITGMGGDAAADGFFTGFITSPVAPIVFSLIFLGLTAVIIGFGVEKGIEPVSKVLMPGLVVLAVGIAIFSLTLTTTDADGVTRTGLEGLGIFLIPNLEGLTISSLGRTVMDALGQAFFSLSLAMGIMVTYSHYMRKEDDMSKNAVQVAVFDTGVAIIAGVMIIPAVFVFMGQDGLSAAGPSLMFVSLPKVFEAMGPVGGFVGVAFFLLVTLAALTSCVSILEVIVAGAMETFKKERKQTTVAAFFVAAIGAVVVCLGYTAWYFEITLPNGSVAQILDVFDYITNSVLMPITALATCILVGWVLKPSWVIEEGEVGGAKFRFKKLFTVVIKYVAPILLVVLLIQSMLGL